MTTARTCQCIVCSKHSFLSDPYSPVCWRTLHCLCDVSCDAIGTSLGKLWTRSNTSKVIQHLTKQGRVDLWDLSLLKDYVIANFRQCILGVGTNTSQRWISHLCTQRHFLLGWGWFTPSIYCRVHHRPGTKNLEWRIENLQTHIEVCWFVGLLPTFAHVVWLD